MTRTRKTSAFFVLLLATLTLGFGRPSRAEDAPKLEEIFPENTLLAIALPDLDAARKSADASRIGELLKQPEMREFLDPIVSRMKAAFDDAQKTNPMIPTLEELDKGVLSSEIGICVFSRGPGNQPGVVLSIRPKDEKAFEQILTTIAKPFLQGQPFPKEPFPLGDGDQAPGVLWAKGRLLVCNPMSEMVNISDRIGDAAKRAAGTLNTSAGFKDAKAGMRESAGWLYVTPAAIWTALEEFRPGNADQDIVKARVLVNTLGLNQLATVMVGVTFAGGEPALETYVSLTDPTPKGLFALIGTKPVGKDMLQLSAADAPYVAASSINFSQIIPTIRNALANNFANILPQAAQQLDGALAQVAQILTFDLEKDLLNNLDSEVVFTQTAHDTGLPLSISPGLVGAIKLKDAAKVEECLKKIKGLAEGLLAQNKVPAFMGRVKSAEYKGAHIYYFNQLVNIGGAMVVTVVKDKLIWADSLNAMKRSLDQLESGSNILSNKSFQTALARASGKPFDPNSLPLSFAFAEDYGSGGGVLLLTGVGIAGGTAVVAGMTEAVNQGRPAEAPAAPFNPFDQMVRDPGARAAVKIAEGLDMNLWPDTEFFVKRRQSHAAVSIKTEKGWFSRTEFPPPAPRYGNLNGAVIPLVLAAVAIPALSQARMGAARAQEMNAIRQAEIQRDLEGAAAAPKPVQPNRGQGDGANLKQIGLALTMYEIENGKMPADPGELYPKYINDMNVFRNRANPQQDVVYTLVTGVKSEDTDAVIAYENAGANAQKISVLKGNGRVESVTPAELKELLAKTQEILAKSNRKYGTVPMSVNAISGKKKDKKTGGDF